MLDVVRVRRLTGEASSAVFKGTVIVLVLQLEPLLGLVCDSSWTVTLIRTGELPSSPMALKTIDLEGEERPDRDPVGPLLLRRDCLDGEESVRIEIGSSDEELSSARIASSSPLMKSTE